MTGIFGLAAREMEREPKRANLADQNKQQADLATERERHLATGERAERTELDFRCPILVKPTFC